MLPLLLQFGLGETKIPEYLRSICPEFANNSLQSTVELLLMLHPHSRTLDKTNELPGFPIGQLWEEGGMVGNYVDT